MGNHNVEGAWRLNTRPQVLDHARAVMAALQDAGIVSRDRAPLDGSEFAFTIESDRAEPVALLVFYECDANTLWIDLLYTAPDARRKGMALALMTAFAAHAAETGMRKVMLGTGLDNAAMQRCAQAAGYFSDHLVMARRVPMLMAETKPL